MKAQSSNPARHCSARTLSAFVVPKFERSDYLMLRMSASIILRRQDCAAVSIVDE
jgi:hypothetical protein